MIIEPGLGWRVRTRDTDAFYPVLEDAQKSALGALLECLNATDRDTACEAIVNHKDEVLKILDLEPTKIRKVRSDKGAKRTKKIAPVKSEPTEAPNDLPGIPVPASGKYKGK